MSRALRDGVKDHWLEARSFAVHTCVRMRLVSRSPDMPHRMAEATAFRERVTAVYQAWRCSGLLAHGPASCVACMQQSFRDTCKPPASWEDFVTIALSIHARFLCCMESWLVQMVCCFSPDLEWLNVARALIAQKMTGCAGMKCASMHAYPAANISIPSLQLCASEHPSTTTPHMVYRLPGMSSSAYSEQQSSKPGIPPSAQ